ncbi:hypothetical protein F5882DRAFT_458289 [Hyaloscypha sp. PMI_1271]|nr:hypothetical protein F5882DRAFT_458289 [Hyaloscypha sp. PMI_1271]
MDFPCSAEGLTGDLAPQLKQEFLRRPSKRRVYFRIRPRPGKKRREMDEPKAEVKASKYAIDNHKQEEELAKLRHESELEDARHKAENDFDKKQAAETEKSKDVRQYEALQKEVTELKDAAANEEAVLERSVGSQREQVST